MRKKLLTVDDSRTVRILVKKAFKGCDIEILEAANGVEGLSSASKHNPDIILLDVTMPVMDGVEMLTRLKGDPATKDIPVIMLTAEGGRDNVLRIAKMGIRDYIVKPFTEDILLKKVGRVVDLTKQETAKTILDNLRVLLVEDKPAIVTSIQNGLQHLPWEFEVSSTGFEGIEKFMDSKFDIVLMSLTLPNDMAYDVFKKMKSHNAKVPILGMVVKTDAERQHKALQVGFEATITKPIDLAELETRACRSMGIDTSPRYFQFKEDRMHIAIPEVANMARITEIRSFLDKKITEAVDSGVSLVVVDAMPVKEVDVNLIKLLMDLMEACEDISLKVALLGNEKMIAECQGFEETRSWKFFPDLEAALA
jgi:two-component system cell cycle response regulator